MSRAKRGQAFERALATAPYQSAASDLIARLRDLRKEQIDGSSPLASTAERRELQRLAELAKELSAWFERAGPLQPQVGRALGLLADDDAALRDDQSDKCLEVRRNLLELVDALQVAATSLPHPRTRVHGVWAAMLVLECWREVEGGEPPLTTASGPVLEIQRLLLEGGWPIEAEACRMLLKKASSPPTVFDRTLVRRQLIQSKSGRFGEANAEEVKANMEGATDWSEFS